ncbi:hypothetical protein EOM82_09565 [bacterium]|nr:hypothetical protein [bacterium]
MDNKNILAIVPYEPKKKKDKLTEKYFAERKNIYLTILLINIAMIFIGFCLSQKYSGNYDKDGLFSYIVARSIEGIFISEGIRFLLVATLAMYLSAFTIFCPAVALSFSTYMALKAGLFLSEGHNFFTSLLLTVFIFISIMYEAEIFYSYGKAKYGIRQIFKPQNVIALSVKTIIFVIIIMLYGMAAGFAA